MSSPGFGGRQYTGSESRALTSIAGAPGIDQNTDFTKLLQAHDSQIKYLAANQKKLQQGVNEATQNPIQQLQQFVADIIVLLGGGQLAEGLLDFGDLQYILPSLGALFGLGEGPFPLDLFEAAQRFFLGYVVPTRQFTDVINNIIEAWLNVFGINKKFVKDTKALITAVGDLFDGIAGLLPSVNELFGALGITAAGLGPLGVVLKPIIDLFSGIDLAQFGNAIEFITNAIDPWIVQLTALINFLNEVLRVLGAGGDVVNSPLPQLTIPFRNLMQFLGNVRLGIESFNPIAAAQQFISRLLIPAGSISTVQPNLQVDPGFDDSGSLGDEGPAWTRQYLDPLITDPDFAWDLIGYTADGSATVHATGTEHGLLGSVVPVEAGQTFDLGCVVTWTGVSGSGDAFALQVMTDLGDITDVSVISSPAASGGWTGMAGSYTVPGGVESIRIRLCCKSGATAGQVWFDDATIRRTSLMQKGFISGLVDDLTELFGNWAAMIDGLLGTGHTFSEMVTFIGAGLSTAATVADNFNTLLTDMGAATASALATLLNSVKNNANDAVNALADLITGAGESTAAALGALISRLVAMLDQISAIFNGSVVTPINTTVQQIQDWYNANVAYLADIPNTAVQGLVGFGTNIGNSVQALSDGVWQGLRAFLGIPSGVGPPQVSSAAQQVRVDLNNATDIASAAALFQANQSISKQSYLSIDPSADPVFPLAQISGASPSTVSVTQTKSVMGVIGLPDNGLKKSVVWLGGSLTNISAVYVNLYKVNVATGEFTRTHQSANIVGDLTSPGSGVAWQFYNLPITAFFPTLQGEWYVAEIVVVGSGTYSVVGVSNSWMPAHPSVYPKALGAARTGLPTQWYSAAGAAASGGNTATVNETITLNAGDNAVYAAVILFSTSSALTSVSATLSGVSMTLKSLSSDFLSGSSFEYLAVFELIGTAGSGSFTTGAHTLAVTEVGLSGTFGMAVRSASFKNVASAGAAQTASGSNTSAAQTVTGLTDGQLVFQAFAAASAAAGQSMSGYNQELIANVASASGISDALLLGDAFASGSSLAFSATTPAAGWRGIAVPITLSASPFAAPSSIPSPTYDAATPWLALAGAAGRASHPPETQEFETAGAHTYNFPSWIEDGDYIDIVPIGAGAGGSYYGGQVYDAGGNLISNTEDSSYKGGGAGLWNPIRLRYGDAYDIPTGTTTLTVVVGAGGSGGPAVHATHAPAYGSDGGNTTVAIPGHPTITATGGTANGATESSFLYGGGAGNTVHQGVTYYGGARCTAVYGVAGNSPGGGGSVGSSFHSFTDRDTNGGVGAPGACYITAVQGS